MRAAVIVGGAVLAAVVCMPAAAESPIVTLTTSWQKIGTNGTSIDVQNEGGQVFLTTVDSCLGCGQTTASAPPDINVGHQLMPLEHRCLYLLGSDLYAKGSVGAKVVVMDGVGCGGRD